MNLGNCPRCGKLFAMNFRDICPECTKAIEGEYQLCSDFLRDHRGATMTELSEETGVAIRQITKFIREGRISVIDAPNLSYPCEVCGTAFIQEGNMCNSCRTRLTKELSNSVKNEQAREDRDNHKAAYSALDKYKK
ncbi:TIGR03826 family flagellar region protein [Paenibacillus crassostreae]|uniref:Flagellar protein n=1 Tax=Paenibacillus crassostreae TaxID=1763538 RepID=A0A167D874_9BACL|nr:TIGR03826 family flagellar region protein [Paenibacillus crassostreae]AOZ93232.1 flagellar protein [Paenibacillus crassostreae]OAB74055.1 flagellar protein [Paenibacillus crassostreae]